ncbi:MAG: prepilin-type N-terminal cleavage/methylation domain-containing protein [Cryobacterium sp.]|nr:prepilin-type N-terminal cleavage/methylation domain-containing protein [Cryobacterium sp.]
MSVRAKAFTAARGESGLTLVEVLVSMVVLGVVMALAAGVFMNAGQAANIGKSVNISTKAASLGLNELARAIRFAASNPVSGQPIDDPALVVAKDDLVTVISYLDVDPASPQPIKIAFTIDSQRRLIEVRYDSYEISKGFWGFKSTPASTQILTGALVPPDSGEAELFTYLDSDNNPLTVPASGLTLSQRQSVAAVKVSIKLKSDDATSGTPVKFESIIGIPNLGINRTGQ